MIRFLCCKAAHYNQVSLAVGKKALQAAPKPLSCRQDDG
ncbi:hypothetical protein AEST_31120 [Alishewanella aestuarii B11]|uniref:Uncharacterized protein n=1 Tax=Alishewanella aestuarii B11 TaxID=1197174 RepID=J2IAC9_9ALTE|nr:hypothetical protein AEST_31120 [Alishewanella aestuarii B11]